MTAILKILPAFQGDSIIIHCIKDDFKIIIDTGTKKTYSRGILKNEINKADKFDLLILTHTDEDHIGGLIKYFDDSERKTNVFKTIWFNSGDVIRDNLIRSDKNAPKIGLDDNQNLELSIKQGITLEDKLNCEGLIPERLIKSIEIYSYKNITITILSPEIDDLKEFYSNWEFEKENHLEIAESNDYHRKIEELILSKYIEEGTLANKTSIALIINYERKNMLFMGDSYPSVIENNLRVLGYNESNQINLEVVKVSHHGGKYGISPTLLKIINCQSFIISGNSINGLPTKECLARIVAHRNDKVTLYFNYKNQTTENIFSQNDYDKYNFEVMYLTKENNYIISIGEKN